MSIATEPVHDAIVKARMHDLRNGHVDAFHGHESVVHAEPAAAVAAPPRAGRIRGLRLRVGRALVAFGSYVEGPCDCPEGAAGVGAA